MILLRYSASLQWVSCNFNTHAVILNCTVTLLIDLLIPFSHDHQTSDHIGVNISERKSETERTKKREFVCFSHPQGAQQSTSPIDQYDPWILPELR